MDRTTSEIIKAAGGGAAIELAAKERGQKLTRDAVYKWPTIGIPVWHWPLIMALVPDATEAELMAATLAAREPIAPTEPQTEAAQ